MASETGARRGAKRHPRPSWKWQDDAACHGEPLVLFFGPDGERQPERDIRERKAKAICAQCPVRAECLAYALSRPEKYGTWSGLNEEERTSERRRQMRGAAAQAARVRQAEEAAQARSAKEAERAAAPKRVTPQPDPALDLKLLRDSDEHIARGESMTSAARLMDMSRFKLADARNRARRRLAEVAS